MEHYVFKLESCIAYDMDKLILHYGGQHDPVSPRRVGLYLITPKQTYSTDINNAD